MEICEKDGYIYYTDGGNAVLYKYTGNEKNVVVPEKIDGYTVTKISIQTFCRNENIKSVTIPDTVTEIGEFAFRGCTLLKKVKLPKTLRVLERGVFEKCINLKSIEIPEENTKYKTVDNVVYSANMTTLTAYPANRQGESYTIPDGVEIIDSYAFTDNRNLKNVNIPETVTEIRGWAFFRSAKLENVNISTSLQKIGVFAFGECKKLSEFKIPDGMRMLESSVFYDCSSLHKLVCPKDFKSAGKHTLFNCPIDTLCVYNGTKPINILPDVTKEFMLNVTYDDGSVISVLFNRTYFYSGLNIETKGLFDLEKYDSFFKTAVKSMTPKESLNVALNRITSGNPPVSGAADVYISYLKKCAVEEEYFDLIKITEKNVALVSRLSSELGYNSKAVQLNAEIMKEDKKYIL